MYNTKRAYLLHITFPQCTHHLSRCPLPGVRNSPTYKTLKYCATFSNYYFVIRNQYIEILSHFATAGHSVKNFCSSHNPVDTAWVSCAFVWLCVCCWIAISTYPHIDFLRVDYFPNYLQVSPNLMAVPKPVHFKEIAPKTKFYWTFDIVGRKVHRAQSCGWSTSYKG